jgi:NAD(P)-dependent dehydrogenase (short-subunit alcohol dehydrogenase family)
MTKWLRSRRARLPLGVLITVRLLYSKALSEPITDGNTCQLVFANAGIAEQPWIPAFDPASAANRPISKPNLNTLNIDLVGQLNTAALAIQYFERQEKGTNGFRGKLVLTASVIGYYPSVCMPMYSSAKAGVVNFMRAASAFYADKDITINCSK